MRKSILIGLLMLAGLAGCTATSGPNYSVTALTVPGHAQTYRVACGGIFGRYDTCLKSAARICGDQQVKPLESASALKPDGTPRDPSSLTFECSEAAAQAPDSDQ